MMNVTLNGYKIMQRKKRKESQTRESDKFHEVYCPSCGAFVARVKKKKKINKQHFECSKCTGRFSLTFTGINESMED